VEPEPLRITFAVQLFILNIPQCKICSRKTSTYTPSWNNASYE